MTDGEHGKLRIALSISRPRLHAAMHPAINLDDELVRRNVKVSHVRIQHMLPPHPHAKLPAA